jgi:hypothetical protein
MTDSMSGQSNRSRNFEFPTVSEATPHHFIMPLPNHPPSLVPLRNRETRCAQARPRRCSEVLAIPPALAYVWLKHCIQVAWGVARAGNPTHGHSSGDDWRGFGADHAVSSSSCVYQPFRPITPSVPGIHRRQLRSCQRSGNGARAETEPADKTVSRETTNTS